MNHETLRKLLDTGIISKELMEHLWYAGSEFNFPLYHPGESPAPLLPSSAGQQN